MEIYGTIGTIGVESGCKILMEQNLPEDVPGQGIFMGAGSIGTIGGANSTIEVIAEDYPIYVSGGSISELTGKTLLIAKRDADGVAVNATIGQISGGYFCCVANNTVENIFTSTSNFVSGAELDPATKQYVSVTNNQTYNVWASHEHTYTGEPTFDWITKMT